MVEQERRLEGTIAVQKGRRTGRNVDREKRKTRKQYKIVECRDRRNRRWREVGERATWTPNGNLQIDTSVSQRNG